MIETHIRSAPLPVTVAQPPADAPEGMPTLFGYFAKFNVWTEINSVRDGKYLERVAPGALAKTIETRGRQVRCQFNHGSDPYIGEKFLGPLTQLHEDNVGGFYEVALLDTTYNRDLVPALAAGLYGASFKFRIIRESWDTKGVAKSYNPSGLPECTLLEVELYEVGPVSFGAYPQATAGLRGDAAVASTTSNPRALPDAQRPGSGTDPRAVQALAEAHRLRRRGRDPKAAQRMAEVIRLKGDGR